LVVPLPSFTSPSYAYAEAEGALGYAFGFGLVHQRGTIRSRLKHFQRCGLIDLNLGGKRKAKYSRAQIAQWLLALILAETGADPVVIVAALRTSWRRIAGTLELVTSDEARSRSPYYLVAWPRVISGPVAQKPALTLEVLQLPSPNPFAPMTEQLRQLRELVAGNSDDWVSVYNLTRIVSRLEIALPRKG
jgi:hypothetical protein